MAIAKLSGLNARWFSVAVLCMVPATARAQVLTDWIAEADNGAGVWGGSGYWGVSQREVFRSVGPDWFSGSETLANASGVTVTSVASMLSASIEGTEDRFTAVRGHGSLAITADTLPENGSSAFLNATHGFSAYFTLLAPTDFSLVGYAAAAGIAEGSTFERPRGGMGVELRFISDGSGVPLNYSVGGYSAAFDGSGGVSFTLSGTLQPGSYGLVAGGAVFVQGSAESRLSFLGTFSVELSIPSPSALVFVAVPLFLVSRRRRTCPSAV